VQWGTEYSNESKQWEPIPEFYISNILAASISLLRTHVLFYRKKTYQEYENLFLLFLVSVQFSFRIKHILSFSKNKNRSQKQKAEKKSKEQIRKQGVISFVKLQILLTRVTF